MRVGEADPIELGSQRLLNPRHGLFFEGRAHFISLGCATRNENGFGGEICGFIGVLEDFSRADAQRDGFLSPRSKVNSQQSNAASDASVATLVDEIR